MCNFGHTPMITGTSIKMNNKIKISFVILFAAIVIIIGFSQSHKKETTYKEQFNLERFKMKQFDLYNPILNTYKIDPIKRNESPFYYQFDSYFDNNNIVRYSFYRSGSYGYLQEFIYNKGRLSKVKIYPVLVDLIDDTAGEYTNLYYYINGELKVFKDELNGKLVIIDQNSYYVYDGILSGNDPFSIKKINIDEYYNILLH